MSDPMMLLMLNMCMVPGVKHTGGTWNHARTAFTVTVEGGHPEAVAKMIAQCIGPDVALEGEVEVEVAGRTIRFNHEKPDKSTKSTKVKQASAVVDEYGTAYPSGTPLGVLQPEDQGWFAGWDWNLTWVALGIVATIVLIASLLAWAL